MNRWFGWHSVSIIHTWKLRILKGFQLGGGQLIPIQEGESLSELSQFIVFIENLLIWRLFNDLFVLINFVAEGCFFQIVLNCKFVEDVIKVLVKSFGSFLIQRS